MSDSDVNDLLNERHSRLRKKFSFYATAIMSKYFSNNPTSTYIFDAEDIAIIQLMTTLINFIYSIQIRKFAIKNLENIYLLLLKNFL